MRPLDYHSKYTKFMLKLIIRLAATNKLEFFFVYIQLLKGVTDADVTEPCEC